ncbi:ferric iron reductase [Gloeocapsa sp. BRSZ]
MLAPEFLEQLFASFNLDSYAAQTLRFTPPDDRTKVIPAVDYLQSNRLMAMIEAAASEYKVDDLRVAAAVSNKMYHWVVLPGVLALMTLAGIGLDASIENASLVFEDGELQSLWLHSLDNTAIYPPRFPVSIPSNYSGKIVSSVDELHQFVFYNIFQQHLLILIDHVHALTKVSKKTLWGNAANACNGTYEDLSECTINNEAVQIDYQALLEKPFIPVMRKRNPLYKLIKTETLNEPGLPSQIRVRATCCLFVKIPPGHTKCSNCPLITPKERIRELKQDMAEVQ